MESLYAAAVVLGFFLLRLGVPLLISLLIGYFLHRLDARWQAEAEAERAAMKQRAEKPPSISTGAGHERFV